MNKAEQLADQCDSFGDGKEQINLSQIATELRRLAPMEARVKELEGALHGYDSLIKHHYTGTQEAMSDMTCAMQAGAKALGEIK